MAHATGVWRQLRMSWCALALLALGATCTAVNIDVLESAIVAGQTLKVGADSVPVLTAARTNADLSAPLWLIDSAKNSLRLLGFTRARHHYKELLDSVDQRNMLVGITWLFDTTTARSGWKGADQV